MSEPASHSSLLPVVAKKITTRISEVPTTSPPPSEPDRDSSLYQSLSLTFIKELHVSFVKHLEELWHGLSSMVQHHWNTMLETIEPTFIHLIHYLETLSWKASKEILAQAVLAGPQHIITFDRKFIEYQGTCSYLLAADFVDHNFTLVISYDDKPKRGAYEISFIAGKKVVSINIFNDEVTFQKGISRLPLDFGDIYVYQETSMINIDSVRGFSLRCNLKFDTCTFTLSGWYFGKTAGLLGTMDNEPSTDFLTSQKTLETDIAKFAQSWLIEPNKCSSNKNLATKQISVDPDVDPRPFMMMCLNVHGPFVNQTCSSAMAYMQTCLMENTPLRIPDSCVKRDSAWSKKKGHIYGKQMKATLRAYLLLPPPDLSKRMFCCRHANKASVSFHGLLHASRCQLINGSEFMEGDFHKLENESVPRSTDIVFIVEAKDCNKNVLENRNMASLLTVLSKELIAANIKENRFSLVVFGGDGVFDLPRSIVVSNNVFSEVQQFLHYFENIPTGNGNSDIFGALRYATNLLFRPAVAKTFILLPCTTCDPSNMTVNKEMKVSSTYSV
uniref:VWFD domain-containing protein n=1 Tax=Timema genevievae TaxID=629358 RepID=A0A7R9K4A3_TIMGE|nr:unnamed protein product [Timema genevievae]